MCGLEIIKNINPIELPLITDYIIIECDGSKEGWGAILLCKQNKYSPKSEERIAGYASGNFGKIGKNWTSLDYEIQALINALDKNDQIHVVCRKRRKEAKK